MNIALNPDGCLSDECIAMAAGLRGQLDVPRYTRGVAVRAVANLRGRTFGKRAARASKLGYSFAGILREHHEDEIFAINTSLPERQGRPMGADYLVTPRFDPLPMVCAAHHVYQYGVFAPTGLLVAYMWLYRCGDLALVSSLLGHGDHLENDIMYLLFSETIREQVPLGGTLYYNRWDSGTPGLRYFKERLGFREDNVEWTT